jgi:hypothetical protein
MKLILPLFINTLPHHQKCLHDSLFNVHETPTKTGLTHTYVHVRNVRDAIIAKRKNERSVKLVSLPAGLMGQ